MPEVATSQTRARVPWNRGRSVSPKPLRVTTPGLGPSIERDYRSTLPASGFFILCAIKSGSHLCASNYCRSHRPAARSVSGRYNDGIRSPSLRLQVRPRRGGNCRAPLFPSRLGRPIHGRPNLVSLF